MTGWIAPPIIQSAVSLSHIPFKAKTTRRIRATPAKLTIRPPKNSRIPAHPDFTSVFVIVA
jgi:hypothetical protein